MWRRPTEGPRARVLRAAAAGLAAAALGACGAPSGAPTAAGAGPGRDGPERPAACRSVEAGAELQAAVDAAPEGGALCLAPGAYAGPVRVAKALALFGPREAVIRSSGEGSTVRLEGDGAALLGVTVDGSGGRFDLLDAAVRVEAEGARVEGVLVEDALFGILVEKSREVVVRGNTVLGPPEKALGMRGDGIRLWEVRDSLVAENRIRHSRDLVVWYSPGNRIRGNVVSDGRYGTHFMYSHRNRVTGNRYLRNVVGVFVMYSREIEIRGNLFAEQGGAAGMGLGAKESDDLRVEENLFLANTVGVYLDTSPLYEDGHNRFARNVFRLGESGVTFHASAKRNTFVDNVFRDLQDPVRVEGRGDALGVDWRRNHWGGYEGFDLDEDGFGDVPYELRSLSGQLVQRKPPLAFFRGLPALTLVEWVGRIVPLFRARTLVVDPEPRMAPPPEAPRAG